jgi:serine phosphatase RsbU (regulator of sigma subunit)
LSATTTFFGPITLEPILGPPLEPLTILPGRAHHLGRLPECEICLPEEEKTVSRRHCCIDSDRDGWRITDLGSRHGTAVNDRALKPNEPAPLSVGDLVRVGPWVFRVQDQATRGLGTITTDDTRSGAKPVPIAITKRQAVDRRRLELLVDISKKVQTAMDEPALAEVLLDALIDGTGYHRAAVIRVASPASTGSGGGGSGSAGADSAAPGIFAFERVDVLGQRASTSSRSPFAFSRSLIRAACAGRPVELRHDDVTLPPMSILSTGSVSAIAIPILLDGRPTLCLYLDSRPDEPPVHEDAAAFCQTLAEMAALCVASIHRRRSDAERLRLTEQMDAAMLIQRQILPPTSGEILGVQYAMELRPGRFVAGDLFDIFPLDEHRVAFFIGDVAGKGLPAAILAATTQSFLNAALLQNPDPAIALNAVNRYLAKHAPENKFVSLWAGVFDTRSRLLRYVDAGHSYWLLRPPGGSPTAHADRPNGIPLRVDEEFQYDSLAITLAPGSRVVLYSDGVVEQTTSSDDHNADPFGLNRTIDTLQPCTRPAEDVDRLVRAVQAHARSEVLGDDLTVASILC